MAPISAMAGSVGAGAGQVRPYAPAQGTQLTDQKGSSSDVQTNALQLIQRALTSSGTGGHDLDLLA
jgi:hypothetical protein